ncbi:MAG: PAS domain-containing sensor histidine kinase [Rhodobacteraceae bacterium]|nr:MAG: PAS domain-containing sensor histidine kinase [Paracoccaceae bacterium]
MIVRERSLRAVLSTLVQRFGAGPREPALLPPMPPGAFCLIIEAERVVAASRAARRALGAAGEHGASLAALLDRLGADDPALREALGALAHDGAGFRLRSRLDPIGVVEATGSPQGGRCLLMIRDATRDVEAEAALALRLADAEAETAALRAALSRAGVSVERCGADGGIVWRTRPGAEEVGEGSVSEPPLAPVADPGGAPTAGAAALPDGGVVRVVSCAHAAADVSLRRFAETVAETFAHLRTGLAIFDGDRRLILSNPALAEIFDADARWLAGRPTLRETLDRLREARKLPEQADYPAWRARLFTLFDAPDQAHYEDVWALPDGRSVHVIGRPHPVGGIAFVIEDVTEAMALQRWRNTAVEVRRATLDMLGDGVAVFGPDGLLRMSNPAFRDMWDLPERSDGASADHVADVAARCAALCVDSDVWSRMRAAVAGGGGRAPWRGRVRLSDGRVVDGRIAPMPDGSTLAAFSDVTDSERIAAALRERAAALEAAEEMRNALVDQLSQRLRTPLTALFGFTQMLSEGRAGPLSPQQAAYLDNIEDAARSLLESVENLADLASMQVGEVSLATGDVALAPALTGAIGLLERRLLERGARIELGAVAAGATAEGDPARLRQMIFNMLFDAVSRAREGETLCVGLDAAEDAVTLWCAGGAASEPRGAETGRVDREAAPDGRDRSGAASGPGLAQALARRVAELHGGSMTISERGGRTMAVCRLPLRRRADAAE